MAKTEDKGAAEAPAKKPLGKRLALIAVALLLSTAALAGGLMAALGPGAVMAMVTGSDPEKSEDDLPHDAAEDTGGHGGGHGGGAATSLTSGYEVLTFEEMIVNIASVTLGGRRTSRFLKVNLALIYDAEAENAAQVAARRLYMRDGFQDYMRQLTETDLQGSIGLATLKAELLRRARAISGSDAPHEVLVADLIIQ